MSDNGKGSIQLAGFVVGALVGAGIALLFAPRSGKETRQWLTHKTRDLKERTKGALEATAKTFQREAKTLVGEVKDVAAVREMPSYTGTAGKGRA